MPRGGKPSQANDTVFLTGSHFAIECKRCGFHAPIAERGSIKDMMTMRYAYQKLHGDGKCEPKKEA